MKPIRKPSKRAAGWVLNKLYIEILYDRNIHLQMTDFLIEDNDIERTQNCHWFLNNRIRKLNHKRAFINPAETAELAKLYDG